jgi:hypothetical protein
MSIRQVFVSCVLLCVTGAAHATFNDEPPCYRRLQTGFFPSIAVNRALSLYNVAQGQWPLINAKINERIAEMPKILRKRAFAMHPNPLEYPFQKKVAAELLYRTLLELFRDIMHESMITDESQIQEMFEFIARQHKELLESCLGKEGYTIFQPKAEPY